MRVRRHNLHDGALTAQAVCAVITIAPTGKVTAHFARRLTFPDGAITAQWRRWRT
jgi:hypothetical protein